MLGETSGYAGFTTTLFDNDGILRRSPLVLRHGDALYPSLALELARVFLLIDKIDVTTEQIGNVTAIEHINLGSTSIPTDGTGRVIIPYQGRAGKFR